MSHPECLSPFKLCELFHAGRADSLALADVVARMRAVVQRMISEERLAEAAAASEGGPGHTELAAP